MSDVIIKDGYEYTKSNKRMRYNEQFHFNQGKQWSKEDMIYLCGMWGSRTARDIAFALGRTESTCLTKVYYLRKIGLFESYRKRFNKED